MLSFAVVIGLAAAYLVRLMRALPGLRRWTRRGVRPWACNVCMSFWSVALLTGVPAMVRGPDVLDGLAALASAGAALVMLTWLDAKAPPPLELP